CHLFISSFFCLFFPSSFFFNDTPPTVIYTLSLHDALPICEWLREAGFGTPRKIRILRIPGQAMYVVRKLLAGGGLGNGRRGGVRGNGRRGGVRGSGSQGGVRGNGGHSGVEDLRVGHGHDAGARVEAGGGSARRRGRPR